MLPQTESTHTDWVSFLTGEMLVAGLLSKSIYNDPTRDWVQSLADEDIFAEAPLGNTQPDVQDGLTHLQQWTDSARGGISPDDFDELRADYTRLLLGPGKVLAPPWESVYLSEERLVFNENTLKVRAWYQRFGLGVLRPFQEPDDHIGLELAFVAHLAQRGLSALEQQDLAAYELAMAGQRQFLTEHLLRWAPEWCALVIDNAHTDFFRGIALLAKGALAEIEQVLGIQVARITTR